ncbi:DUF2635 domain-containing protein [Candidatus Schmidhempelia bombi]|uniref:DUF2635 domain-containing protein n=1 Tax=Candidatus Schmidhempelia bombi str. Bimp TaxID=1387197 RepID=A0AB94IAJ4_9GAMM|nr:DUF2635 domain-containing protein [Candidatus Schmidhempelia bombi]TEA26403.1 DUF2635 domain-containing protein [Candidatus Schmidhempelia bombi str. Bimp]
MIIKPVNDKQVYDPDNGDYLPANGRNVEFNQYWARRLVNNDVEEVKTSNFNKKKRVEQNDN